MTALILLGALFGGTWLVLTIIEMKRELSRIRELLERQNGIKSGRDLNL